jgi:hypothetical protein
VDSNDNTYQNPFTLLGLKPEELGDLANLKRAKQRLLAEADLSVDGVYTNGNTSLNKYEIEQIFADLEHAKDLDFYALMAKIPDLDAFLSGNKDFNLEKIVNHNIWLQDHKHREKANKLLAAQYGRRLKNAVIANKQEIIKQLTCVNVQDFSLIYNNEFFDATKIYLTGVLSDIRQNIGKKKWLDYNEIALWDYAYTNCSPDTLNLLPDSFAIYRDDLALSILKAAKSSYIKANSFFNTAQTIAFKFNLTEKGYLQVQNFVEETDAAANEIAAKRSTPTQKEAKGCLFYVKWYFIINVGISIFFTVVGEVKGCFNTKPKLEKRYGGRLGSPEIISEEGNSNRFDNNNNGALGGSNVTQQQIDRSKILETEKINLLFKQNQVLGCPTIYNKKNKNLQKAIVEVSDQKNYVIYVRTSIKNEPINVYSAVINKDKIGLLLLPKNEDFVFYVAIGNGWSDTEENPCGKKGFLAGNVRYYVINTPKAYAVRKSSTGEEFSFFNILGQINYGNFIDRSLFFQKFKN